MRHLILSLCLSLAATAAQAFETEDHAVFGPADAARSLRVISTTDTRVFRPVLEAFIAANPDVSIDYTVASSAELMRALSDEGAVFDVAISSAMDLQTKLANDGLAQPHNSPITARLPGWAHWRDQLFAFTQEPAAIVLSRAAFEGLEIPRTRQELISVLRAHPDRFEGRLGTYDLRSSGLGYLFATQDARTSETYWRLTEVMGALGTSLYCCSSEMLDRVADGELAVAYNVLVSYAQARIDSDRLAIVLPADFTTVMLRTALIPAGSDRPALAGRFIDHLLHLAWSGPRPQGYPFDPIPLGATTPSAGARRIRMGPGLLVFLDRFKRRAFMAEWESAILQR